MRRVVVILVISGLVAVAGWYGYQRYQAEQAAEDAAATAADEAAAELENIIWASGHLEPITWVALNPETPGRVTAIHVYEGQWVDAGAPLVDFDTEMAAGEVARAQAAVAEAQAALDQLLAGATAADIAAARANLATAEAAVAQAAGAMLETQAAIDTANAQVALARREYAELASHPTTAEQTVADAQIFVADAAVKQAQAAYNLVRGNPQIGALPESRLLNEATAAITAAEAQAALVEQGATPQQLAVAAAAIALSESQVAAAESRGPGAEADVQAALAGQSGAQAGLEQVIEGATPEELAAAQARVQMAEATLAVAEAQLRRQQLIAPFAGQISAINVRLGEMTPTDADTLMIGDPGSMHVKTTDLRETDVVNVREGMRVEVTFDAQPERLYTGTVTRIAPMSTLDQGSTNYTVYVDVDDLDRALRWGMTAFVNIRVNPADITGGPATSAAGETSAGEE